MTEWTPRALTAKSPGRRIFDARFDGGEIASNAGALLLGQVQGGRRILASFGDCFEGHRDPSRVEHTARELVAQRVLALALGYEDVNDHEALRFDTLLASLVGKADPTGGSRSRERDLHAPLASPSTLHRIELGHPDLAAGDRYKRVVLDPAQVDALASRVFKDFQYRTRDSWSRSRRLVAKAEHLARGSNPRFVVTTLDADEWPVKELREKLYCARGEMENRIKEQ